MHNHKLSSGFLTNKMRISHEKWKEWRNFLIKYLFIYFHKIFNFMNIKWYMNCAENEIAFSFNWIQWSYKWYSNSLLNSFLLKTSANSWYSEEILLKFKSNDDS